ncbi:kinase-like protein [Trametes coccinea BRFM310]|uniref:Kinase-like protein n=1 Tax=Trametes coccinea (strain BRFM310) TaxID=1353009 RepID=A0A1Y2IZT8_TRAC3|nr:kinase-like protein [Trametes coccinea BRFM310]
MSDAQDIDIADSESVIRDLVATLTPIEEFWKARQSFFVEHGYTLRPRFRPGWVPSWRRDPTIDFLNAEDFQSFHALRPHLMDARRLSDNKLVLLKKVRSDSSELEIAKYLWSEELRNDPRNHSVPLLDVIPGFGDEPFCYMVMPFYRYIDDPPMVTVENVLDCCEQLLEGLVFMHNHGVAHRDCAFKNIMYDPDVLYPQGFHPMRLDRLPYQTDAWAPVLSRRDVQIRYYYIDFGISSHFTPDDPDKLVTGLDGIEKLVPELSDEVPYDPFKVDIFVLGRMMYETFIKKFTNVGMIVPLVQDMTAPDPVDRPNAADALQRCLGIRSRVSALQASWRLRPVEEPLTITAVLDSVSLVTTAFKSIF